MTSGLASLTLITLRQILQKIHDKQVDTYQLFVDNKTSFDSSIRDRVIAAISAPGIPAKLIRLCRMTFSNSCSFFKVVMDRSESFDNVRGCSQGDHLSNDLFNFVMESVLRKEQTLAHNRQWDYFSKKCPVACLRCQHRHQSIITELY